MVREDVFGLKDLAIIVAGALGLGHTVSSLIQVQPWGAEAAFQADLVAVLIPVRKGAAGHVAGGPTLQVHLALWAAQRTEAGLPPPDVHASPGTGGGVAGHGAAKAVSAVGAGADVVAAVLHVGQRAHGAVAGLELGGRQQGARLLRIPGQARVEAARIAVLLLQVFTVPVQLPGVPEVLHQGLRQACGRDEVVSPVAVEIPAQATRLPRVDWGQHHQQPPTAIPVHLQVLPIAEAHRGHHGVLDAEVTLQERDLDILAVHGHASPMLQLHKAVVQSGQADSD